MIKRHLKVLAPVISFIWFVGCGGGDDAPPPALSSNPQTTPEIHCAAHRLDDALNKCKGGIQDALPLLLAQQNGGSMNPALLISLLQKPRNDRGSRPPGELFGPGMNDKCVKPQVDKSSSCNDDMITAFLLFKSAPKKDGSLAINDPYYKNYLYLKIRQFVQVAALQMNLNPMQQLALASQLQGAVNSGALGAALSAGDTNTINSYFNQTARQVAGTTSGANQNNNSNQRFGLQPTYPLTANNSVSNQAPRSTSLNLSSGSRAFNRAVVEDNSKNSEVLNSFDLSVARGIGLSSSSIGPRP